MTHDLHHDVTIQVDITIIGGGASCTLLAAQMLCQAASPLRVSLIERAPEIGRGIAYITEIEQHLLNVPTAKMSARPHDADHFVRWLVDHRQSGRW